VTEGALGSGNVENVGDRGRGLWGAKPVSFRKW